MNRKRLGICSVLSAAMCLTLFVSIGAADTQGLQGAKKGISVPVVRGRQSTADHSKFKVLNTEFSTAQEVTLACLSCHTEAGHQFQQTYHWTWQSKSGVQKGIGKKNVLNNF